MLDVLRRGASGWIAKILLAFLIFSFAVWGIADVFRGFRSDVIASVGDTDISGEAFRTAYERQIQQMSRQGLGGLSREQAARFGIPGQVLSRLTADATLDEAARRLGLSMSDAELRAQITEDPQLKGPDGQFNMRYFVELLRENGWNEDQYIRERRRAGLRDQLADATAGGIDTPQAYLEALWRLREEERILKYVLLDTAALGTIEDPSPEALAKFFEERKAAFRAPEYRKANLLALDQDAVLKSIAISDEEAKAFYDKNARRFVTPERRRVLQVPFATRDDAEAALRRIRAGEATFEGVQAEMKVSATDADLGLRARDAFLDPALGEAAFKLGVGEVSEVVAGRFRPTIVKLTEIAPEQTRAFEDAKADIKGDLARGRADRRLFELRDKVEEGRDGSKPLAEIAAANMLSFRTVEVDREGKAPDGTAVADLPGGTTLVSALFETDVGVETFPLNLGAKGFVWYEVTEVKPARDRTLDEVRDEVANRWRTEEIRSRLATRAGDLLDRVKKGETLEQIAESAGLQVVTTDKVKRAGDPGNELAPAFTAAFQVPEGGAALGRVGEDKLLVMVVQDVFPTFYAETDETRRVGVELSRQVQDGIVGAMLRDLQTDIGVSVNQAALQRAIGAPPT